MKHGPLLLALLAPTAHAEGTPPAPPPPDYSAGFALLREYGLPDVAGADYVKFEGPLETTFPYAMANALSGNGWLHPAVSNQTLRVLSGLDGKTRVQIASGGRGLMGFLLGRGPSSEGGNTPRGTAKPGQLEQDLEKILAVANQGPVENRSRSRRDISFYDYQGEIDDPEWWLLLAAQAHRSGFTNQANALAQAVLTRVEEPRDVLRAAVQKLLDRQYEDIHADFTRTGDWAAYHAALASLLERRGPLWTTAPGAHLLLAALERRLRETPADLQGEGLDDYSRALAREWVDLTPARLLTPSPAHPDWLWNPPTVTPQSSFRVRLLALGPRLLHLLIALADDEGLVGIEGAEGLNLAGHWSESGSGYYRSSRRSFSTSDAEEDLALAQYKTLNRPRTRGEIARELLETLLARPGEEDEDGDTARDLVAEARALRQAITGQPPAEIAFQAFQRTAPDIRLAAGLHLLRHGQPNHREAVLKTLEDAEAVQENFPLLQRLASDKDPAAKPLLESLLKTLDPGPIEPDSTDWEARQRAQLARQLRAFLLQVQPPGVAEALKEFLEASPDQADPAALSAALKAAQPQEAMPLVLAAAAEAPQPATVAALLKALSQTPWRERPLDPTPTAALWSRLLEDTRLVIGEIGRPLAVSLHAAQAFERLSQPASSPPEPEPGEAEDEKEEEADSQALTQVDPLANVQILGYVGLVHLRDRARARLIGQAEVSPLPDADRVPAERIAILTAALSTVPATPEFAAGLSLDERLWINREKAAHPEWEAPARAGANRVVQLELGPEIPPELARLVESWQGEPLTVARLRTLAEAWLKYAQTPSARGLEFRIEREPVLQGVYLGFHVAEAKNTRWGNFLKDTKRLLLSSGQMGLHVWNRSGAEDPSEDLDQFWSRLQTRIEETTPFTALSQFFLSAPAPTP